MYLDDDVQYGFAKIITGTCTGTSVSWNVAEESTTDLEMDT